ncbi:MAG: GcrA family cell cycle regulator [Alphaproteobacteria bacterium]|jgi:GcrA cell cycle regulator|nr:global cell cycle regulator GcrA-like protein [Rhodospirillaceae bacterium]MBT6512400.1 global cell cycle regulator GcrA-like protein [Rhodospirillaceae bacterium]MBT7615314.1 global cell cycle regulator GcrA-like protein [Rhodospirillaceae bacterium]MBT7648617.1 global cell cycle regulator GcrA-like protein [Rhodospirillaceae bacterium]MDG2482244.1 GcrA family cell cycle regulator [Alphaproteobacteria bacterium]
MSWTDEKIERLKELWDQGLSTAEIGRELGVSKNAVVGKSHRLALKPRPSPISGKAAVKAPKPKPKPKVKESSRVYDVIKLGPQMCRWPFGDPGDHDFHFCGKTATVGKPYCDDHCAVAYVTKSSSRDRDRSASPPAATPIVSPSST